MEIVPLSADALKDFILNRNNDEVSRVSKFDISYKDSKLKKEHFLNYIANLRLCVTVTDFEDDGFNLLSKYVNSKVVMGINNFAEEIAKILLLRRGYVIVPSAWTILTTIESIESFMKENEKELVAWETFLASIPYTAPFFFNFYSIIGEDLINKGEIEVVDNPDEVGPNALNLLFIEDFLESYLASYSTYNKKYYRYLMNQRCFESKNLRDIIGDRTSILPFIGNLMKTPDEHQRPTSFFL